MFRCATRLQDSQITNMPSAVLAERHTIEYLLDLAENTRYAISASSIIARLNPPYAKNLYFITIHNTVPVKAFCVSTNKEDADVLWPRCMDIT